MRVRMSLYFQTLTQCLPYNEYKITLLSLTSPPFTHVFSSPDKTSRSPQLHLSWHGLWVVFANYWFLLICASLQPWCPALKKGCGLNQSSKITKWHIYPCWEAVTTEAITAGFWVPSSVYNLEAARAGHSPGTYQAEQPVLTKAGGKWKLLLKLLGITQKNEWAKELLAEFNRCKALGFRRGHYISLGML